MNFLDEIRHAIKDGLGKSKAAQYDVREWNSQPNTALAYSREDKQVLILSIPERDTPAITGEKFLDMAKAINKELGAFVSPNQKIGAICFWGGKTQGPVHVYRFKIFNEPQNA